MIDQVFQGGMNMWMFLSGMICGGIVVSGINIWVMICADDVDDMSTVYDLETPVPMLSFEDQSEAYATGWGDGYKAGKAA